ncbi:dihydrodipicolinate synthase family protein [Olegusella massiliensis]|uniref:dihydrodipicolinate synthase family protein n=1 Tax=Olegusella massiliensis TaxID=1776381 RepID=UPI00083934CD|nr:dihydrodipicolinate synthase family protein [Olegusella massiliensis]
MGHFIEGVLTEICTPFTTEGEIDFPYLHDMIAWQVECGIKAFFVNGYAGESHELSFDEKIEVLKAVHEAAQGKAKIMACSFENDVRANKRLIDAYEETGLADCYCITAPPFFKFSQEALYDWSAELIDYAKRPVYIYNCVEQAVLFAPDTLAKLANEHKNLRGFKDASTNVVNFQQCVLRIDPESFDFLGGCDGFDGIMVLLGAVGCVSFMAVPFPREMIEIVEKGRAGDWKGCIEAQQKVLRIRNVVKKTPFNAGWNWAMQYGFGKPTVSRMGAKQDWVPFEVKQEMDELMVEFGYKSLGDAIQPTEIDAQMAGKADFR